MGFYEPSGGGLADSHPIGIWDSNGQLIMQATIPAGLIAPRDGNFRYIGVPNTTLVPGEYIIGALYFANHPDLFNGVDSAASMNINPNISSVHGRAGLSSSLSLPPPNDLVRFGPNFQFTTGNNVPTVDAVRVLGPSTLLITVTAHFSSDATTSKAISFSATINGAPVVGSLPLAPQLIGTQTQAIPADLGLSAVRPAGTPQRRRPYLL